MKAVQLVRWQAAPELRDVEVPEPGPGEVLVKVGSAGLCHSDIDIMDWPPDTVAWPLPFTLGHETAGTVAALGAGAGGFAEGDPVLVYALWGCGACRQCVAGAENVCTRRPPERFGSGLGADGGLAEYLVVPSPRLLVPIDGLDPALAAPLSDAGLTPYHALRQRLPLRPGSTVVVIGAGGLGHIAIQLLRALTPARVIAIDLREQARDLALAAGAHAVLDANGLDAARVREETGPDGAALVLDFVGIDTTLALAASVVEFDGHVTIVGRGGGTFPTASTDLPLQWSASRISYGTLPELREVVELARAGVFEIELERLSLDAAIDGYRRLRESAIVGRAVVVP
jgi:alcohol dehydrogenase, propanol-preferring